MKKPFECVSDIPDNFILEINSQDRRATLEHIDTPYSVDECMQEYGYLFTLVSDGEIVEVYGCIPSVPYMDAQVTKLTA